MKYMRETLHNSDRVTVLFAGSVEHMMREMFTSRHRAFYGFGGFMELTPIALTQWREGLTERFAEDGCEVDAEVVKRIVELGGLHPRAIMLIAQQTHTVAVEAGLRTIDLGLVLSGWRSALQAERARHVDAVETIRHMGRSGATALRVVGNLAHGRAPYRGLESKAAARALRRLQRTSIVHRAAGSGAWELDDPLLAAYVREEIAT